jgi:hypothetical protein
MSKVPTYCVPVLYAFFSLASIVSHVPILKDLANYWEAWSQRETTELEYICDRRTGMTCQKTTNYTHQAIYVHGETLTPFLSHSLSISLPSISLPFYPTPFLSHSLSILLSFYLTTFLSI